MTQYAFAPAGVILNLLPEQPTVTQSDGEVVHAGPTLTPVPDDNQVGWVSTDGGNTFVAPDVPPPPPREATGYALISALTDDQIAALTTAKAKDQRLLSARVDPWPEDNPKVARIAGKIGLAPKAWFDLALAPPSA